MKIKNPRIKNNGGYKELFVEIDGVDHFVAFEQRLLDQGLVQVPSLDGKIKDRMIEVEPGNTRKLGGLVKSEVLTEITKEFFDILNLKVTPENSVFFSEQFTE